MPELPEVETIRRDLQALLLGRLVGSVAVLRPSVIVGSAAAFARALRGREFLGFRRHGKLLLADLSGGRSLLVHLRMTGQLRLHEGPESVRFARVLFRLRDGASLVYADCRALGRLEVVHTQEPPRALRRLGPDALAPEAAERLLAAAARRRTPVKCLLLDQSVIAGIGNIYASEILHVARIAPDRPANELSGAEGRRLQRAVSRVLAAALAARGTTFSDYRTALGQRGEYARRLRVYGRKGCRCPRRGCGGTVIRCVQRTRSTFSCERCQR